MSKFDFRSKLQFRCAACLLFDWSRLAARLRSDCAKAERACAEFSQLLRRTRRRPPHRRSALVVGIRCAAQAFARREIRRRDRHAGRLADEESGDAGAGARTRCRLLQKGRLSQSYRRAAKGADRESEGRRIHAASRYFRISCRPSQRSDSRARKSADVVSQRQRRRRLHSWRLLHPDEKLSEGARRVREDVRRGVRIRRRRISSRRACCCVRILVPSPKSTHKKRHRIDPKLPLVHNLLGEIYLFHSQIPEAIAEFQKELALNPGYAPAYYKLADAYSRIQKFDDAEKLLQRSIWLDATSTGPYILMGKVLQKKGRIRVGCSSLAARSRHGPEQSDDAPFAGPGLSRHGPGRRRRARTQCRRPTGRTAERQAMISDTAHNGHSSSRIDRLASPAHAE